MTLAPAISSDAIRETFREWNEERNALDAELSESLAALEAYQGHLDEWHQQLVRERKELCDAREQFDHDRELAAKNQSETSSATLAELHEAREKITALTTLLLNRTEELRTLDLSRAELQTELELARTRERESKAALDDYKHSVDQERSQWAEELKHLRTAIERQLEEPAHNEARLASEAPASISSPISLASTSSANKPQTDAIPIPPGENPLLGSIAEQFGKLRQQRAIERQSQNRQR